MPVPSLDFAGEQAGVVDDPLTLEQRQTKVQEQKLEPVPHLVHTHKVLEMENNRERRSEERRVGKECVSTCRSR